jgi:SAM-dependent methyltransferase
MNEEKSDKGNGWHNYTKAYHQIFKGINVNAIFELGIGSIDLSITSNMGVNGVPGASLRGWRRYFTSAHIFAADIDPKALINEERINSYICDQTQVSSIKKLWGHESLPAQFDIMIDDGLHEFHANVIFFENSIHKLKKGGIYVVEDIMGPELGKWQKKIQVDYTTQYPDFIFRLCCLPNTKNACDNNLLLIYT